MQPSSSPVPDVLVQGILSFVLANSDLPQLEAVAYKTRCKCQLLGLAPGPEERFLSANCWWTSPSFL